MQAYNKFIVALIGAGVTIAGSFGLNVEFLTPELQATISTLLTAVLVYIVPNRS